MQNDTIAAIATAMSPSGIGIIRISGDDALSVIDRIYKSKNNKKKIRWIGSLPIVEKIKMADWSENRERKTDT